MPMLEEKKINKFVIISTPIFKNENLVKRIFIDENKKDSEKWVLHQKSFHNQN